MIGAPLARSGLKLAVAESCTGGLLGSRITDVPGSSAYFLGGIVAYADALKTSLLGVPPEAITRYGAVSAETALLMAQGALDATGADLAVAVTGIAGPDGGTAEKPVGTVYVALVSAEVEQVEWYCWLEDREGNKRLSADAALRLLARHLREARGTGPRPTDAGIGDGKEG